jgi:hypothetical protein
MTLSPEVRMAPSRVLFAALALAALPLLSCSSDSVIGPLDGRDRGLVTADADIAQCPGEGTETTIPATCGYPPSYGKARGRGQLQHASDSPDRPGTKSQFMFEFDDGTEEENGPLQNPADTLPRGFIDFKSLGNAKSAADDLVFAGGDPFVLQVTLESENQATPSAEPPDVGGAGTIYVEGPGTMNGAPDWFFCMFANDTHGHPKRSDSMDIRFWSDGGGGNCENPDHHFVGKVAPGDVDAMEGEGGSPP